MSGFEVELHSTWWWRVAMPSIKFQLSGGGFIFIDLMALPNRHRMLVALASVLLAVVPLCRGQDPNVAQAKLYYESGTAFAGRGDLDGAIAEFSKAIGLDPKNPLAYSARGNAKINTEIGRASCRERV